MKIIKRNDIFNWFINENPGQSENLMIAVFNSMTDETLINMFGLIQIRSGKFYKV